MALLEPKAQTELVGFRVRLEQLDLPDQLVYLVPRVYLVQMELLVFLEILGPPAHLVFRDLRDFVVILEIQEVKDS